MSSVGRVRAVAVSVLILVCVACGGTATPVGEATAPTDPAASPSSSPTSEPAFADHGVSFDHPTSWVTLEPFPPDGVAWSTRVGPPIDRGYVEVIAYEAEEEVSREMLEAFAEGFFRFIENEAMGDRPKGQPRWTTIAGVAALEAAFESDELGSRKRALAFADGTIAYGIDCFVDQEASEVADGCDMVIDTFALT